MKNLIKLVDYTNCRDCSKLVKISALCKKCQKSNKFYSYKFDKEGLKKKDKIILPKNNYPKLNIVYYVTPKEVNTTIGLQPIHFSSIDDLTAYLVHSNEFPISELTSRFYYNYDKLPQLKHLMDKISIQYSSKPPINSVNNKTLVDIKPGLEELVKLEFWTELFRSYILESHIYHPILPLNCLDLLDSSHPVLIAIYCYGFMYKSKKSQELNDYMDNLEKKNLKRVQFKPCISNIYALFIHYRILYKRGDIKKAESLLAQLSRMSYSLGVHLESNLFESDFQCSKNLLFNIIISNQVNISSIYKTEICLEYHKPSINSAKNSKLQLLPEDLRRLLNYSDEEWFHISELCSLNYMYSNQAVVCLNFCQLATQDRELESYCYIQYSRWMRVYEAVMDEFQKINLKFNHNLKLNLYEDMILVNYLKVSLLIMEYWRYKSATMSQVILNETFELSIKLLYSFLNAQSEQVNDMQTELKGTR
ncbi:hypothetical protein CONCODRAFT_14094 [Conidiobolus coronatus NRRL 28638]|uniref:Transcription factor domain-containing protein n=1 Tax=Conidiobolus coronatus (strain ATCC 28846 / CBS 209.66 / NRRL 28638) TaxID=796925 RepID=A0A137NPN5_CONC2|nr:hypothetical protein CONCODRAFT_14094 [Conidiobolus coronatus NRRL 28638]|eukprot:KXN64705.1 hypothetical protein CONCODRAFT_14094 [Conidiobolus coronatus NRRL 28638]